MEIFKVGETVILIRSELYPEIKDIEVEVIGKLGFRQLDILNGKIAPAYRVASPELTQALKHAGSMQVSLCPKPNQLKRLPSHKEVLPNWDECVFKPYKEDIMIGFKDYTVQTNSKTGGNIYKVGFNDRKPK